MIQAQQDQIEGLIDSYGLAEFLEAVSLIASEKASHIRGNWQDAQLARLWVKASNNIEDEARKVRSLGI